MPEVTNICFNIFKSNNIHWLVNDLEKQEVNSKLFIYVCFNFNDYWQPGTKTDEIDEAVHQMIIENGAYPSPLGYGGFPKSVCTSVNECICHGIPDSRALQVRFCYSLFLYFLCLFLFPPFGWATLLCFSKRSFCPLLVWCPHKVMDALFSFAGWWYNQYWCHRLSECMYF